MGRWDRPGRHSFTDGMQLRLLMLSIVSWLYKVAVLRCMAGWERELRLWGKG